MRPIRTCMGRVLVAGGAAVLYSLFINIYRQPDVVTPEQPPKRPFCNASNYYEGHWVEGPLEDDFDTCTKFGRNCALKSIEEKGRVAQAMRWAWVPQTCDLHPFEVETLLKILDGRRVYFIGDSLNGDMHDAMNCMVASVGHPRIYNFRNIRSDHLGCLKDATAGHGLCAPEDVDTFWQQTVVNFDIREDDILLLNAGAHWYTPPAESELAFQTIAESVKKVHPTGPVIFRTTIMGHNGCEKITRPGKPLDGGDSLYNWRSFAELNRVIARAFRKADFGNQFHVLHVDMFEERGDGHVSTSAGEGTNDCLHYCTPGPINVWNLLLHHLLATIDRQSG